MNILIAFAPFFVFAVLDRLVGITEGLVAGALVALALTVRDLARGRTPKILEIGTLALFGSLSAYALLGDPGWSIPAVRLRVDAGLLLIVLASLALRRPFTLQYAREDTPREFWDSPTFLRINDVITAVWALAFAVMVAADVVLAYMPELPPRYGIIVTVLAILGAVKFTQKYPEWAAASADRTG